MVTGFADQLEANRSKLLGAIAGSSEITFLRPPGNIGDHLIHAGTRQLLAGTPYSEVSLMQAEHVRGHTALVGGCGGWCGPFHDMPAYLPLIEERFEHVIVLPSSFDIAVESVKQVLRHTRALVFAREEVSFRQIRGLCRSELAFDCAFFFDYGPYRRHPGQGLLNAFRADSEAAGGQTPPANNDISLTCETLDEWLWTIARHADIHTDRAHVTIAGALLGKRVEYRPSNYHKVPAIVDFSLQDFPVSRLSDEGKLNAGSPEPSPDRRTPAPDTGTPQDWIQGLRLMVQELDGLLPKDAAFLFVDDEKIGPLPLAHRRRLPFLERDGQYWGTPTDAGEAIRECDRLRREGATFLVFVWPAFWWLDHYGAFHDYLRANFRCILKNELLVVFDLRGRQPPAQS